MLIEAPSIDLDQNDKPSSIKILLRCLLSVGYGAMLWGTLGINLAPT